MDTLIYVHHTGQYWLPDTTSKVALKTGQKNFIEIFYDLTYSLSMILNGNKPTCDEYKINSFDHCLVEVFFFIDTKGSIIYFFDERFLSGHKQSFYI